MIHPNTELRYISPEKGYGVVATTLIPKGTITWVQDKLDQVFEPAQINRFEPHYRSILSTYSFRNNKGQSILCWDHGRFVNHSFKPSCITTAYDFELAVRDIHPGQELTDDYGFLNLEAPFECLPEKGIPRTRVLPDDILRYHDKWDRQLWDSFQCLLKVPQPLLHLVETEHRITVENMLSGKGSMDSILNCYYKKEQDS
jgi:hypothetical protein